MDRRTAPWHLGLHRGLRFNMGRRFFFKGFQLLIVVVVLGMPAVCFAGKVDTWTAKNVDFSRLKTYQWLPPKIYGKTGIVENDSEFAPLIKDAVGRELDRRGLKEVAEGGDLQVATLALAESIPQLEAVIFPGNVPLDFATPIATMGRYNREGTLVVNLILPGTQKSAWFGMAKETIDNKPGAGKKKIAPAAAKMFKKYPKSGWKK